MSNTTSRVQQRVIEQFLSLEHVPADVLVNVLLKTGLSVNDIDNLCKTSQVIESKCNLEWLWDKIFRHYIPGTNYFEQWQQSKHVMPEHFLRFIAFYATARHCSYVLRMTSPSKKDAVEIVLKNGKKRVRAMYYLDDDTIKRWKETQFGDEDDIEDAFLEYFGEDIYHWRYLYYRPGAKLGPGLHVLSALPTTDHLLLVYTLLSLGWKPEAHTSLRVCIGCGINEDRKSVV